MTTTPEAWKVETACWKDEEVVDHDGWHSAAVDGETMQSCGRVASIEDVGDAHVKLRACSSTRS